MWVVVTSSDVAVNIYQKVYEDTLRFEHKH